MKLPSIFAFSLIALFSCINNCFSQISTFKEYDAGDIVYQAFLDTEGNMWLGGRFGALWKYDGSTLIDFSNKKTSD